MIDPCVVHPCRSNVIVAAGRRTTGVHRAVVAVLLGGLILLGMLLTLGP